MTREVGSTERTAARTNTLEQARPRILTMMEQRKREELVSAYVERLKAGSRIEYGR